MSKKSAKEKKAGSAYDVAKEVARERFYSKLKQFGVLKAAEVSGIDKDTLYSYAREGGAVPNIADIYVLSEVTGIPACEWFESEAPPTEKEREFLAKIKSHPSLQDILDLIPLHRFRIKGEPSVSISLPNTRSNFKVHKLSEVAKSGYQQVPMIRDLAAGFGREEGFEVVESAYVENAPKDTFVAVVRGDSMVSTLNHGDYILLSNFNDGIGYTLESTDDSGRVPYDLWRSQTRIEDGQIVIVDLKIGEGPTLKRVRYDLSRGKQQWKMQIVADNPTAWRGGLGYQIAVGDSPVFYARMVALCEKV